MLLAHQIAVVVLIASEYELRPTLSVFGFVGQEVYADRSPGVF
jgi:hypothetical protein